MKITGQILKENRERKGITLSEVSLATKITIKTLVAIEDGDPRNLPPKTFLRGFVRSYALFLSIDTDEILRTFHEEMGSTLSRPVGPGPNPSELNAEATEQAATPGQTGSAPDASQPPQQSAPPKPARKVDTEKVLRDDTNLMTKGGIAGGILLLIVLIIFLKGKMDSYEAERATGPADLAKVETAAPQPEVVKVDETSAAGVADLAEEPTPAQTATPSTKASASPAPSPAPAPAPSPTPTATPTPKPSPSPTATPTPKPSPTPTATPTPKPSPSPTPAATPAVAPTGKTHEILIEALDQVDVEVIVDGEPSRTIKLRGEQVQSIKAKRKATLKFSDGGAVNLIVNGTDRGVPGDLGKPIRVELP